MRLRYSTFWGTSTACEYQIKFPVSRDLSGSRCQVRCVRPDHVKGKLQNLCVCERFIFPVLCSEDERRHGLFMTNQVFLCSRTCSQWGQIASTCLARLVCRVACMFNMGLLIIRFNNNLIISINRVDYFIEIDDIKNEFSRVVSFTYRCCFSL